MTFCAYIIGSLCLLLKEMLNLVNFFLFLIFHVTAFLLAFQDFLGIMLSVILFLNSEFNVVSTYFIYQLHFRIFLIITF